MLIIIFFLILFLVAPFLFWSLTILLGAYAIISMIFVTASATAGIAIEKPLKAGMFDNLKWWHCPAGCLAFAFLLAFVSIIIGG